MSIRARVSLDRTKRLKKNLQNANAALDDTLSEVSDMMYDKAHEVTGFMKSRIGYKTSGFKGSVFCDADYAVHEINKGGDHDFVTDPVAQGGKILKDKLQDLVSD